MNQLFHRIRLNQNVPELVRKWCQAVEDPNREHESELFKKRSGRELTDAMRRYHAAFSEQGKARNEIFTRSIRDLRRLLDKPDLDPLIRVIASAVLQLGYYRSDRLQDAAELFIPECPLLFERLASLMRALAARCQGKPASSLSVRGLGFAELSTRSEDALLERELGSSSGSLEAYE